MADIGSITIFFDRNDLDKELLNSCRKRDLAQDLYHSDVIGLDPYWIGCYWFGFGWIGSVLLHYWMD